MPHHDFKVGDHVQWKGHTRHCTPDEPQYEIRSDRTDHVAMHKGSALRRVD